MRFANILFGAAAVVAAAGCAGNPDGQGDEGAQQIQSTLEATGKVDFYVSAKGHSQGQFRAETTQKGHEKDIPAFRFHMGAQSPHDVATGVASGKRTYDDVTFTKEFGASDPQFLSALATNEVLDDVTFTFVRPDPTGKVVTWQTMKFSGALVTKVERATTVLDNAAKTEMFADEISFTFNKITVTDTATGTTFTDTRSAQQ